MINIFFLRLVVILSLLSSPFPIFALEQLSGLEMKKITGQNAYNGALTDFSLTDTTARIFINNHIKTWTQIKSLKIGYYERSNPDENINTLFDQNWTDLSFGTSTNDLVIDGFIMKADFNNLNTPEPELKRLIIGTNRINGEITGNFESFTGAYNPDITPEITDDGVKGDRLIRQNLGQKEFNFQSNDTNGNQGIFLILSPHAPNTGIHALIGYSEGIINSNGATNPFSQNQWWDSP